MFPFLRLSTIDATEIFDKYYELRKSSFISFFSEYRIDVPLCFYNSKSLRRLSFELPLLKFSNFLMFDGKKEKFFLIFLRAFQSFIKSTKKTQTSATN
jgi:hypothetical protein